MAGVLSWRLLALYDRPPGASESNMVGVGDPRRPSPTWGNGVSIRAGGPGQQQGLTTPTPSFPYSSLQREQEASMTSRSLLRKAEAARSQAERKMAFRPRGCSLRVWSREPEAQRTHREGRILQATILKPTRSPDSLLFSEPRLPVSRVGLNTCLVTQPALIYFQFPPCPPGTSQ